MRGECQEFGVGFTVRSVMLKKLEELPLSMNKHLITTPEMWALISTYELTLTTFDED